MNENNKVINDRIISGSATYILRESKNCNMWWTHTVYIFLKHFSSMNANNEDINGRIINGSPIYISRIKNLP